MTGLLHTENFEKGRSASFDHLEKVIKWGLFFHSQSVSSPFKYIFSNLVIHTHARFTHARITYTART